MLKFSKGFLQSFRRKSDLQNIKISKYFNFMTAVNMIQYNDFDFISVDDFKKFKLDVERSLYNVLINRNNQIIKPLKYSESRFKAINSILLALTKLRALNPAEMQKSIHVKNPRGFFTYKELTNLMKVYSNTLNDQLKTGSPSFQLILARSVLNKGIKRGIQECIDAKKVLESYLDDIVADISVISKLVLHPCYQGLTIKYLKSKDVLCTKDRIINYPGEKRPDNIILRYDPSSNYDRRSVFDQSIINIPDYIKFITVDYTAASNPVNVIEKFDKDYQSEDRYLVIVLLGQKAEKQIGRINRELRKIQRENPDKYKHISVLTSKQYEEFLGFDKQFRKDYDLFRELTFSLLDGSQAALGKLLALWQSYIKYYHSLQDGWILQYFPQDIDDIVID